MKVKEKGQGATLISSPICQLVPAGGLSGVNSQFAVLWTRGGWNWWLKTLITRRLSKERDTDRNLVLISLSVSCLFSQFEGNAGFNVDADVS